VRSPYWVVAERFQRQRLRKGFSSANIALPVSWCGPWMRLSPSVLPVIQIRLRLCKALELLPFNGVICAWLTPLSTFPFRSGSRTLARKCRNAVVRQNVAIQGIQARIVEVRRQHSLAKIVQNHDPPANHQAGEMLLVKLGPHPRTGFGTQAAERFPGCNQASLQTAACDDTCPLSGSRTIGPVP